VTTDPRRPGYHFTAPAGWINDPLAVTWHEADDGGRYELFYQFNPDGPVWAPECRWGQATSPDLVRWREPRTALEPAPDETGCWSGSLVVDAGIPVIVYTSVVAENLHHGRVGLATGDADWRRWTPDPAGPLLVDAAAELDLAHLRDPYVWRDGETWRMVQGAGGTDGRPSVVQFSSPDLRRWQTDGVLVAPEPGRPGPGGAVWECPQLFRLGDDWALVVSVWNEQPGGVACALGDYDGRRFTPRSWQPLAGDPLYATTTFPDADGRRCAISWVQEADPVDGGWAGTLSVPWLLERDGDRVTVRPHPDVDGLRTGGVARRGPEALGGQPLVVEVPALADVDLHADPAGRPLRLDVDGPAGRVLGVVLDPAAGELRLSVAGRPDARAAVRAEADGSLRLRLLLDAGVVEAFPGGGAVAAARLPPAAGNRTLRLSSAGDAASLHSLAVHGMERVQG
jgi:beta-fructofuranosidase